MSEDELSYPPENEATGGIDLAIVTESVFEPHVGSKFILLDDEQNPVELTLLKTIDEHRESEEELEFRRPFSLVFEASDATVYPQKVRCIRHPDLGEFELFLIPIGVFDGKIRLSAVFN